MKHIVVLEDNNKIALLLKNLFEKEGYETDIYSTGDEFYKNIYNNNPDLIILDILLPDTNGLEVCKQLKSEDEFKKVPLIALTSRSDKFDVITGLTIGFDDYITKPFDNYLFLAKIKAILRKESLYNSDIHSIIKVSDNFIIDKNAYTVNISEKDIKLSSLEFKTLCLLVENKNKVINRNTIINHLRGDETESSDRSIDKLVNRIRKKLKVHAENIISVYGVGYCFKQEDKEKICC